jgi:hypothetical protein
MPYIIDAKKITDLIILVYPFGVMCHILVTRFSVMSYFLRSFIIFVWTTGFLTHTHTLRAFIYFYWGVTRCYAMSVKTSIYTTKNIGCQKSGRSTNNAIEETISREIESASSNFASAEWLVCLRLHRGGFDFLSSIEMCLSINNTIACVCVCVCVINGKDTKHTHR